MMRPSKIIEENFLLVTPQGEKLEGVLGFARWCTDRQLNGTKKALEYAAIFKKYAALRKNGLLNGMRR